MKQHKPKSQLPPLREKTSSARQQVTLLCIDDDVSGLAIRKMMFESKGYRVLTADSGQAGLETLASANIDAVILDYKMPGMDGAEAARNMRRRWPDVPIVMLSGYPDEVPEDAVKLVNAFVTKGGSPDQLFLVIEDALGDREAGRITILNVDDNDVHRYAITHVLRKAGFSVVEARTGREALAMASSLPSLVVLDINLPDMLGFEVCRQLKADPVTRDIPVVHASATYPAAEAIPESLESGAGKFVQHPGDLLELVEVVREELRRTGRM